MAVAVLVALKAGGAYVLLDPAYRWIAWRDAGDLALALLAHASARPAAAICGQLFAMDDLPDGDECNLKWKRGLTTGVRHLHVGIHRPAQGVGMTQFPWRTWALAVRGIHTATPARTPLAP
jgi:hypothetical protein